MDAKFRTCKESCHREVVGGFKVSYAVSAILISRSTSLTESDLRPSPSKSRASTTPPTSTTSQSRTSCSQVRFFPPKLFAQVRLELQHSGKKWLLNIARSVSMIKILFYCIFWKKWWAVSASYAFCPRLNLLRNVHFVVYSGIVFIQSHFSWHVLPGWMKSAFLLAELT